MDLRLEYESRQCKPRERSSKPFWTTIVPICIAMAMVLAGICIYSASKGTIPTDAFVRDKCEENVRVIYDASTAYFRHFGHAPADIATLAETGYIDSHIACLGSNDLISSAVSKEELAAHIRTGEYCSYVLTPIPNGGPIVIYEINCNHTMKGRRVGAVMTNKKIQWMTTNERDALLLTLGIKPGNK